MAWLVQLPPPHLAPFPALSIIAPHYPGERENAFHALHSMQTSKLIYVARLTMSEMKSQKKKEGRGKSLHNLANKQASKSQQTAGIVLLSLLATDARYLKTLKQHTRTNTHDAYATWYVLQAKPASLSVVSLRVIKSK